MTCLYKCFVLVFLIPLYSIAQSNYQPAEVVTSKGDTLHGFINYHEWANNPKNISFKTDTGAATAVKYTPRDIRYFNVHTSHLAEYVTYTGPLTMDNTEINHLSIGRDSSVKSDTVFLKVLQKGKNLVLFCHSDDFKTRFFIARDLSAVPEELIYRVYWNSSTANGKDRTVYENSYKGQLYEAGVKSNAMMGPLKTNIQKADYVEGDLINITSKINGVSETDQTINNPTKPKKLNIAIAIGGAVLVAIVSILQFSGHRGI
jgi:hypothetical protein